jgi:hypothetical protein
LWKYRTLDNATAFPYKARAWGTTLEVNRIMGATSGSVNPILPPDSIEDEIHELLDQFPEHQGAAFAIAKWHINRMAKAEHQIEREAYMKVAAAIWTPGGDANVKLAALAFVGGLSCTQGVSMAELGRRMGIKSKNKAAAISKEANKWADRLNMRSPAMKSDQSRDNYSRRERSKKRQPASVS